MNCEKCGAAASDSANFCPACGARIGALENGSNKPTTSDSNPLKERLLSFPNALFLALYLFAVIRYAYAGMPIEGAIARAVGLCAILIVAGIAYNASGNRVAKWIYVAIGLIYCFLFFVDVTQR